MAFPDDVQAFLRSTREVIATYLAAGLAKAAMAHLDDLRLNADEYAALWRTLESHQRTALKKAYA